MPSEPRARGSLRFLAAAGVAIATAAVRGIARLPLPMLKLAFSVLGQSLSNKTASLTAEQFHHAFANSLTETESFDALRILSLALVISWLMPQQERWPIQPVVLLTP